MMGSELWKAIRLAGSAEARLPTRDGWPGWNGATAVKRVFTASVQQEDDWYVAQALEVDVASQGDTVEAALANLREALELYFTPPVATDAPRMHQVEVEVAAS